MFLCYLVTFIFYKLSFRKKRKINLETIIDVFGLVEKTNEHKNFNENYLIGMYQFFEKYNKNYAILIRPYPSNNPIKLRKFFKTINNDTRDFVFEYEFLGLLDFLGLFSMIIVYPFKTLNLIQNEKNDIDKIFNNSLIEDLKYFSFNSLARYILGEKLSKITSIKKIYSWCEFQVIERSFNYS